jgi:Sec-independent protein translocase protein TatA
MRGLGEILLLVVVVAIVWCWGRLPSDPGDGEW